MQQTKQPTREYLSLAEAADRFGMSTRTVRRWITAGQVTGYRIGPRAIRVDVAELEALVRVVPAVGHMA